MRKFPIFALLAIVAACLLPACSNDDDDTLYDAYATWRENNAAWLERQVDTLDANGQKYYTPIIPSWDPAAYVLIHYFNDRKETEGNLSPLLTSTVDTRYYLRYYNDVAVDSSANLATNGPGIFRTDLTGVITGWVIAMEDMRVGDTAEIIIPYQQGYGVSTSTSVPPYTNLKFNVRLVDIVDYEKNPK